tara:strand:- start:66 stop:395 length:330 start_codon:yes stop_codon:yes gene_type:complete
MNNDIELKYLQYSWRSGKYSLTITQEKNEYIGELSTVPFVIPKNKITKGIVLLNKIKHPKYEIVIGDDKYDCVISIISSANNSTRKKDLVEKITMNIGKEDGIVFEKKK